MPRDTFDGTWQIPNEGGHTFVALATNSTRLAHGGAFANLCPPFWTDLSLVVRPDEACARAICTPHHGDTSVWKSQFRIERSNRRVMSPGFMLMIRTTTSRDSQATGSPAGAERSVAGERHERQVATMRSPDRLGLIAEKDVALRSRCA